MVIVVCVLLAGAAIGFTLLVRDQDIPPAPKENPELKHLETRRQVLYENLKDLQFEYHQGKLSEEDYQSLKNGFLGDMAGVMDQIERLSAPQGGPSAKTPKPRKAEQGTDTAVSNANRKAAPGVSTRSDAEETTCPACHAPNPGGNRFCGSCGASLPAERRP